jgi:hypothetical protein
VDLDTLIISVFCLVDDEFQSLRVDQPLRSRGPAPSLADSEVVTMELVGEFLGMDQDKAISGYFRRHYAHFFPAIARVHRTTFVRQAANLWQRVLPRLPSDSYLAIVDSLPLPVCQFARAKRCQRFRGEAAFGKDHVARQTFYGFRFHVRIRWPGIIVRCCLAPANVSDLAAVPDLVEGTSGFVLGDRNYWSPRLMEELRQTAVVLVAPYRVATRDPDPTGSFFLSRVRYRIDTVFGELADRWHIKKVWARDAWHLWNRLLRKILSHTVAVLLNVRCGNPPLQLQRLVA